MMKCNFLDLDGVNKRLKILVSLYVKSWFTFSIVNLYRGNFVLLSSSKLVSPIGSFPIGFYMFLLYQRQILFL